MCKVTDEEIPIVPDNGLKVIDVHKMYSDRTAAIRQIMLTLVAVTTAGVSAIIALRDDLNPKLMSGMVVYCVVIFAIAVYLKVVIARLVVEYENRLTRQLIFNHGLLPIDALGGKKVCPCDVEPNGLKRLSTLILVALAITCTAALVWGFFHIAPSP